MANNFQNITSGLAELKNFYQGPMIDDINETLVVHQLAESVKDGWSGYQVIRPIRVRRNQGVGATSDGGNLPQIGRQTTVQASFQSAFNYLRFGVTGPMIKASVSDVGSFVRSAAYELKMGYLDIKSNVNRQLGWDGSAKIASLNAGVSGSNTMVIAGRQSTSPALQFVDVGTQFDIYNASNVLVQAGITVSSISSGSASSATATLIVDQNVTCGATDYLVLAGSKGQEILGLFYAEDNATSTIYGVDRSQYISYQGNVNDVSGVQLTLDAMQSPWNEGLRRGNVQNYDTGICDFTSLRYYQKLLVPDKRYVNTTSGDPSFGDKGKFMMEFNGVPLKADKDFPTRFAFVPKGVLKHYVLAELEFADETGSMMIAQTNVDSFEVRVRYFTQLFNEQPAACAVVQNYISP